jgi:hypothetical protein
MMPASKGGLVANARVERVHVPGGAAELHAHLLVDAALHHTSKLGAGKVDIGVTVTFVYLSQGKYVALQGPRTNIGGLDATGADVDRVRVMVKVPYGGHPPDPGTKFHARAQVFTKLPGNIDVAFGPAV